MQTHNLLEEKMSHMYCVVHLFAGNKVSHLRKSIHDYHDGISSPLRSRKSQNKIHGNISPGMFRNREGCIESSVLTLYIALLENLTPFHKIFHIFLQFGPIVLFSYHKECFVSPEVRTEATGMQFSNQFLP